MHSNTFFFYIFQQLVSNNNVIWICVLISITCKQRFVCHSELINAALDATRQILLFAAFRSSFLKYNAPLRVVITHNTFLRHLHTSVQHVRFLQCYYLKVKH